MKVLSYIFKNIVFYANLEGRKLANGEFNLHICDNEDRIIATQQNAEVGIFDFVGLSISPNIPEEVNINAIKLYNRYSAQIALPLSDTGINPNGITTSSIGVIGDIDQCIEYEVLTNQEEKIMKVTFNDNWSQYPITATITFNIKYATTPEHPTPPDE